MENLEKSLAISANFIDGSNFELAKKELSAIAYIDYRAQQLLEVLTSTECRVQSMVLQRRRLCQRSLELHTRLVQKMLNCVFPGLTLNTKDN